MTEPSRSDTSPAERELAPPPEPPTTVAALLGPTAHVSRGSGSTLVALLLASLGALLLAARFLPLVLALVEDLTFGTHHVEDLCRQLGIHDELGDLYELVFGWIT